ncbi:NAD(P)/FAD-dependent oxidoreductase [Virgibacillus oceani]|uniref:Ferredoxin--NADP reductase n=1 Tax=Virgibacillus oceani TaxID=1479511 RepID=A0A917HCX5_9BACI|nr:NAD(P)/FAD-dependent oxidoreductase [Virgibacillus oceani]GGG75325.1 ferredoxin--NADP reductase 1 [Virgibacillus oceani]
MDKQLELYDVTIVGGGPVGLFTAFYSGMREMKTKIIEYLPFLGGKVSYFYPEKMIRDVGGIPSVSGDEFTEQLIEQAKTFDPTVVLGRQVTTLQQLDNGNFIIRTNDGEEHYSRTIILATGFGSLKTTKLDIPGADNYENGNLHYTVRNLEQFSGKRVVISGGGNSAIDWANELESIAEEVTLIYRKNTFSGIESNISKMKNSSVNVITPYKIVNLAGERENISSVLIENTEANDQKTISLDHLIVNHGFAIDLGDIAEWGCDMIDGTIKVDSTMQTSIPGIFAVGDIANYQNKLHLIAGGFNEGPIAINSAKLHIAPNEELKALFSTNMETFQENS